MLRFLCFAALSLTCLSAEGQVRTEARTSAKADITLPKYKLTRTNGQVYYAVSLEKNPPLLSFVDTKGRKTKDLASSFRKIEEIPEDQAEAIVEAPDWKGGDTSSPVVRTAPRVTARTKPRKAAPQRTIDYTPPFVPAVDSGAGFTATGIPMHTGPRGGIYHISKNGNKVYHSRKK